MCNLPDFGIDDLERMALQSLQLRFCLSQLRFGHHLRGAHDAGRFPTDGPLYGDEFTLRGSMTRARGISYVLPAS